MVCNWVVFLAYQVSERGSLRQTPNKSKLPVPELALQLLNDLTHSFGILCEGRLVR